MNETGFNLEAIDGFKKYEGYEGSYIIDYYIRDKDHDSVWATYTKLNDALDAMDALELWDDYMIGYVLKDGSVSFHIEL